MVAVHAQASRTAVALPDGQRKAWLTAQARLALDGYDACLIDADDGRPELVARTGAQVLRFNDLEAVDEFLAGGQSPLSQPTGTRA